MNSKKILSTLSVLMICVWPLSISSCAKPAEKIIEDSRFFMGTIVQIKVSINPDSYGQARAMEAINKAFEEIKRIEDTYSVYKDTSEISKINRLRKNERLQISDGVFNLINKTLYYSEITGGAFDITVKPLMDLWKKARDTKKLPNEYELKSALGKVGYKNIALDQTARTIHFKKDGMGIDLGGAAKGYATDRAVSILEENGIENALVNSGGDMYCLGKRSSRELWKVGIQHPRNRTRIFLEIKLKDKAIDTSGDYERYFTLEGRRYSHILDPRTGYPIGDNIVSSSVIAQDSTVSDILATAMCVMGEKGLDIVKRFKDVDVILVQEVSGSLSVKMSEGFDERYDVSKASL